MSGDASAASLLAAAVHSAIQAVAPRRTVTAVTAATAAALVSPGPARRTAPSTGDVSSETVRPADCEVAELEVRLREARKVERNKKAQWRKQLRLGLIGCGLAVHFRTLRFWKAQLGQGRLLTNRLGRWLQLHWRDLAHDWQQVASKELLLLTEAPNAGLDLVWFVGRDCLAELLVAGALNKVKPKSRLLQVGLVSLAILVALGSLQFSLGSYVGLVAYVGSALTFAQWLAAAVWNASLFGSLGVRRGMAWLS